MYGITTGLLCVGIFAQEFWCQRPERPKTCRFRGSPPQADLKSKYAGGGKILKNLRTSVWRQPHSASPSGSAQRLCKRLSAPPIHKILIPIAACGRKRKDRLRIFGMLNTTCWPGSMALIQLLPSVASLFSSDVWIGEALEDGATHSLELCHILSRLVSPPTECWRWCNLPDPRLRQAFRVRSVQEPPELPAYSRRLRTQILEPYSQVTRSQLLLTEARKNSHFESGIGKNLELCHVIE